MNAWAEIDLSALRENLALMRGRVAPAELLAVVKDDAYGHGLDEVTHALAGAGVTAYGALDPRTALRVRQLAPHATVFAWLLDSADDLAQLVDADIELGVTDPHTLERLAALDRRALVHLKFDSGLSRAGIRSEQWGEFVARAAELERAGAVRVVGVWTHISEASDSEDTASITLFTAAVGDAIAAGLTPSVRHLAASAAAFARADARFDRVRVGAFLYGIAPGDGLGPGDLGLRPVMTLRTTVTAVDERTATIDYGGAAGLLADAAGTVRVAVGGVRHPIVEVHDTHSIIAIGTTIGTGAGVSGDTGVGATTVSVGDIATLFGSGDSGEQSLQEWADAMGTIGEELVTRVHPAVERRYQN